MKNKLIVLFAGIAMVFSTSLSYAAFGVKNNDTTISTSQTVTTAASQAIDLNVLGGCTVTTDGSVVNVDPTTSTANYTFQSTLVAQGRPGASTQVASSSTNLAPANLPWGIILKNIGGAGPDNLGVGTQLPNGVKDQELTLLIASGGGESSWIVTPNTSLAMTKITFTTRGQGATLLYMNDTIGWVPMSLWGATVTTKQFTGN